MTETVHHPRTKRKFQHECLIDGCTVKIGRESSTVTGDFAPRIAARLPKWLSDGMLHGQPTGTFKKYPEFDP